MSGIYIRDMRMPQNCDECPLNSTCSYSLHMPLYHTEKRHDDCPLIEVPEPHGRLGDLDALDTSILQAGFSYAITRRKLRYTPGEVREKIQNAPTVIPASESKEHPAFLPQYELTPRREDG